MGCTFPASHQPQAELFQGKKDQRHRIQTGWGEPAGAQTGSATLQVRQAHRLAGKELNGLHPKKFYSTQSNLRQQSSRVHFVAQRRRIGPSLRVCACMRGGFSSLNVSVSLCQSTITIESKEY